MNVFQTFLFSISVSLASTFPISSFTKSRNLLFGLPLFLFSGNSISIIFLPLYLFHHSEESDLEFVTSVYKKPNFTGQYLRWNSFSPQKQKINLIDTLVHRAFMICSKSKLDPELGKIHSILLKNGYPKHAINSAFKQKLQQLNSNPVHTMEKCPVYLHIP